MEKRRMGTRRGFKKKTAFVSAIAGTLVLIGASAYFFVHSSDARSYHKAPAAKEFTEKAAIADERAGLEESKTTDFTSDDSVESNEPSTETEARYIDEIVIRHNNHLPAGKSKPASPGDSNAPAGPGETPGTPEPSTPGEERVPPVPLPVPLPEPQEPPEQNVPPQPEEPVEKELETTVWYPFWGGNAAYQVLREQPIDSINLFWFELAPDGQIWRMKYAKPVSEEILRTARSKGIRVIATVSNTDGWSDYEKGAQALHRLIATGAKREQLADRLIQFTLTNKLDGLDINFEVIKGNDRENFSQFVEVLSGKLHAHGKILSVSVYPKTSDGGWDGPKAQDWKRLGQVADEFKIMTYNYSTSTPGPGAPLSWLDQVIRYGESQLPAHKLYVGLPAFGYQWAEDGSRSTVTFERARELIKKHNPLLLRDLSGEPHFTFIENGKKYTVCFQDRTSLRKKMELIAKNHPDVGGITEWYLGAEDPAAWDVLNPPAK
ncbi:MAG: glycosyl hydrolase family 18 protein [Thermoactinomyces sp.]